MDKEHALAVAVALWNRVQASPNTKFNRKMFAKAVDEEFIKIWSKYDASNSSM